MSDGYSVQEISPQDLSNFYAALRARTLASTTPIHERPFLGRPTPEHQKGIQTGEFFVRGHFGVVAREVCTGEVAWKWEQDNLMTDYARYLFYNGEFTNMQIGFIPSKETPVLSRSSVSTDPAQCFQSGNLGTGTVTPATYTRTYSFSFPVPSPSINRTLGCVCWSYYQHGVNIFMGPEQIAAYALLTPPKTQTTTQTLEVVYKISMNPVY